MACCAYRGWTIWHVHHDGGDSGNGLQQQWRGSESKVRTAPQKSKHRVRIRTSCSHPFGILVIMFSHCLSNWLFLTDNIKVFSHKWYQTDLTIIILTTCISVFHQHIFSIAVDKQPHMHLCLYSYWKLVLLGLYIILTGPHIRAFANSFIYPKCCILARWYSNDIA